MLGVGQKFPEFSLKATVSTDLNTAFSEISNASLKEMAVRFLLAEGFHVRLPDRDR